MPDDVRYQRPVDGDHALLVGALAGAVMESRERGFQYESQVIDDAEGNHLATFAVSAPSGRYLIHVEKVQGFTCPRCGAVSHNPHDLEEGYCGQCHDWTAPPAHAEYVTKTGKVLTESDIYDLAQEAEQGYDVSRLQPRKRNQSGANPSE